MTELGKLKNVDFHKIWKTFYPLAICAPKNRLYLAPFDFKTLNSRLK
jgi:hypothetical protein